MTPVNSGTVCLVEKYMAGLLRVHAHPVRCRAYQITQTHKYALYVHSLCIQQLRAMVVGSHTALINSITHTSVNTKGLNKPISLHVSIGSHQKCFVFLSKGRLETSDTMF